MWNGLHQLCYIKGWDFVLHSCSGLTACDARHIWCNAHSIKELVFFSYFMFVERISVLGEDFAFNSISATIWKLLTDIGMLFQSNAYNQLIIFHRLKNIWESLLKWLLLLITNWFYCCYIEKSLPAHNWDSFNTFAFSFLGLLTGTLLVIFNP